MDNVQELAEAFENATDPIDIIDAAWKLSEAMPYDPDFWNGCLTEEQRWLLEHGEDYWKE